jgi:hypothetical protein
MLKSRFSKATFHLLTNKTSQSRILRPQNDRSSLQSLKHNKIIMPSTTAIDATSEPNKHFLKRTPVDCTSAALLTDGQIAFVSQTSRINKIQYSALVRRYRGVP